MSALLFLDAPTLETRLPFPYLIGALEEAFREGCSTPPRENHRMHKGSLLLMPAWDGRFSGVKVVTIHPGNREKGRPTIHGLFLLFDAETGEPAAVLDGRMLTLLRTAATSALAAQYLARGNSEHHLIIGAGALAPYLVRAMASVRPITRVSIWNRNPSRAEQLQAELTIPGVTCVVAEHIADALSTADIVSTATRSHHALVRGADLPPAVHLDLVGAYAPDMVEADPDALALGRIFVDTWDGARQEAGDLIQAVKQGRLDWDDVVGDLQALTRGSVPGRIGNEVTVFKSVGSAIEDLAAGAAAINAGR